ncbi:MAG: Gfo/Idh/MocA family oxidoreductase [Armatimonadota bacterium]
MGEAIRIGIIGGGGILGAHAPGYKNMSEKCRVVAVAEPVPEKAGRIRELMGDDVIIYPDYTDLLEQADVDAVDIILPHDLHLPATEAAARAGKHILVEKVMARNVWECDRMIEACDSAGVTLTVCHDRRYDAQWQALKKVVDSGLLGEIVYWKLDHNQDVNPRAIGRSWIAERNSLGGGAIMSCLTHQIDALRWYGGEVDSLVCMNKVIPERMEGETIGVVAAHMKSGALAQLSINWMTRSGRDPILSSDQNARSNALWYEMVQVCGIDGEAYYMMGRGTFAMSHRGVRVDDFLPCEGPVPESGYCKIASGNWAGHTRCIEEWIHMLRGEPSEIVTDGRSVRGTVEVAEAAALSAVNKCEVKLPVEPKPWEDA